MAFSPTKRKRHRGKRPKEMLLQITSLVDVFTILLIFLLKTYSTGFIMQIAEAIQLPLSTASETLNPAVVVAFNNRTLYVDGEVLVDDLALFRQSEDLLVEPLYQALRVKADRLKKVAAGNPSVVFTGEIILQADKAVPFRFLKKVIYTAGQAEYVNQSLAVMQKGD